MNKTKINKIIRAAKAVRRDYGIKTFAEYGDCVGVAIESKRYLLENYNIESEIIGGYFYYADSYKDHTWLVVNGMILDPTFDQFLSLLETSYTNPILLTINPGIYFQEIDNEEGLFRRYRRK